MMTKAISWSDVRKESPAKECRWISEAIKGKESDCPLESLEGNAALSIDFCPVKLISVFWTPKL